MTWISGSEALVTLVSANWNNSNHAIPIIQRMVEIPGAQVNVDSAEYILFLDITDVTTYPTIDLQSEDVDSLVLYDIRSATLESMKSLYTEFRRVIRANLKTPGSGYSWMQMKQKQEKSTGGLEWWTGNIEMHILDD